MPIEVNAPVVVIAPEVLIAISLASLPPVTASSAIAFVSTALFANSSAPTAFVPISPTAIVPSTILAAVIESSGMSADVSAAEAPFRP